MEISLDTGTASYRIQAYGEQSIQIAGQCYSQNLIVAPENLLVPWTPHAIAELNSQDLAEILKFAPEVVILGTGKQLVFPTHEVLTPLLECGLSPEIMDTGAACRTYNLLMSEGRQVVAGILLA